MSEPTGTDAFVTSRAFDAPREAVWRAWTDQAALAEWFGPAGVTTFAAHLDLRPGGVFHFGMRAADGHEARPLQWR